MNTLANLSYILSLSTDYILFGDDTKTISNNETLNQLIDTCPNEKIFYLEELVKIYIKSVKWKFFLSQGMVEKFLKNSPKFIYCRVWIENLWYEFNYYYIWQDDKVRRYFFYGLFLFKFVLLDILKFKKLLIDCLNNYPFIYMNGFSLFHNDFIYNDR